MVQFVKLLLLVCSGGVVADSVVAKSPGHCDKDIDFVFNIVTSHLNLISFAI